MTRSDPIPSGLVPYDLLPPGAAPGTPDYSDPSVPLPPLPDIRRTPLADDEVLVTEPYEDGDEWYEATGYGQVVSRATWSEYRRVRRRLVRIEAELRKGERCDLTPIPSDEERRHALMRGSWLTPRYTSLRNKVPRSREPE